MRYSFLTLAFFAFSAAAEGLCLKQEQVIFSCKTHNSAKFLSVCASKRLDEKNSYVQYRFGKPKKIELQFPADKKGSISQFKYAHYFRYQVDRAELSFTVNSYRYSVFNDYEGDSGKPQATQGVAVSTTGAPDKETEILCSSPAINRLHQLENIVPCDQESTLANCD